MIALGLSAPLLLAWRQSSYWIRGAVPLRTLDPRAPLDRELLTAASAVAHTWVDTHPPEELDWNWGEGVLAFGIERVSRTLGDTVFGEYSRRYLAHHEALGVTLGSSDDTTPGLTAAERVVSGDPRFTELAKRVAEYHLVSPRTPSGMVLHLGDAYPDIVRKIFPDAWVDSVFHVVPTLMRASSFTREARFRDEGARQLRLFLRVLSDPNTHLVTHAYDDAPNRGPIPPFDHGAFWARGNGWMLATLVDAIEYLPSDHEARAELLAHGFRLEKALRARQRPSGLFGTLLQDHHSYEETAGSALILYGMAKGLRLGLFGEKTYTAVARGARGLWSVVRRRGPEYHVTGTSLGTNPVEALYARTPTADQVSYGVGAWLLAALEIADAVSSRAKTG
jgi:rhamnogalacturonyl hydrolase YesR